jgi:DNA processing protein
MSNNLQFWLGLNLVKGIGSARLRGLYHYFQGDMEAAWRAPTSELLQAGLDNETAQRLHERRKRLNLAGSLNRLYELDAAICTIDNPNYPTLLAEIPDAPPMFYYRGTLLPAEERALAVVGTRRATTYGREVAYDMAAALSQQGVTIISGLALGIDAAAHQGALDHNGRTIAVLANGIDSIYPSENRTLADAIIAQEQGLIITEHPPKTEPAGRHFPVRNRLISGLSLGVLIVEAGAGSGALTTASLAAEQGREVFAIPGNINRPNSQGTNRLIQDGAKMVLTPEDILEELNLSHQLVQTRQVAEQVAPGDETEQFLLSLIELEPLHVDDIAIQANMSIQEVNVKMMQLFLKGLVQEIAPQTYIAKR